MIRLSIAILFCISSVVIAQTSDTTSVCWRARPLANCKSWLITETAAEIPVYSSVSPMQRNAPSDGFSQDNDFSTRITLTLGGMKNVRHDAAIGLTGSLGQTAHSEESIRRVEARYRRWKAAGLGLDLSAGYTGGRIRAAELQSFRQTVGVHGVTGSVGFSTTYVGIDVRHDVLRTPDRQIRQASHFGVRVGSRLAPAALLAVAFLAIAGGYGAYT